MKFIFPNIILLAWILPFLVQDFGQFVSFYVLFTFPIRMGEKDIEGGIVFWYKKLHVKLWLFGLIRTNCASPCVESYCWSSLKHGSSNLSSFCRHFWIWYKGGNCQNHGLRVFPSKFYKCKCQSLTKILPKFNGRKKVSHWLGVRMEMNFEQAT